MDTQEKVSSEFTPMCWCILDIFQIMAVLKLEYKLFCRKILLYLFFLVIPLIGLTFVKISDAMTQDVLKPKFDEVLKSESPFGNPFSFPVAPLNLPEAQVGVHHSLGAAIETIPTKILYDGSNVNIDHLDDLLKFVIDYNLTFYNIRDELSFKKGIVFEESHENEMDETLHESLHNEEFVDEYFNHYIGGYIFEDVSDDNLEYTIQYEVEPERSAQAGTVSSVVLQMKNNYTYDTTWCSNVGILSLGFECETFMASSLISLINAAYLYQQTGRVVESRISQFPYESEGFLFSSNSADMRLQSWLCMLLSVIIILNVYVLVSEKEQGHRTLASMMGMRRRNYLFAKYLCFYTFYLILAFMTFCFGRYVFQYRIFTQVHSLVWFLLIIGHGFIVTSFSFLFSTLFTASHTTVVPSILFTFFVPGTLYHLTGSVMEKGSFNLLGAQFLFPFQLVDAIVQLKQPCIVEKVAIGADFIIKDAEFLIDLVCTMIMGSFYFMLYLYFDRVLPQRGMVRKSVFYGFHNLFNFVDSKCCCGCLKPLLLKCLRLLCCCCPKRLRTRILQLSESIDLFEENDQLIDSDVLLEDRIVQELGSSEMKDYGIVVSRLQKQYKRRGPYAVKGVSFRVSKNELFGLLGENGAGKTTTIRMLVGELSISGGEAFVFGKNVSNQMSQIRTKLGVCPQFDILYPELTPREHLDYYSAIRGTGFDIWERRRHVEDLMREAELLNEDDDDDAKAKKKKNCGCVWKALDWIFNIDEKRVGNLSAGDRRKLSLAIALIGGPEVIFLDEPTTGLCPLSKRKLWRIIQKLKKNRSIVLTTHSMEEAEVLCDRIGIMTKGDLKCLGTVQHLKHKFGKGYRLSLNIEKEKKSEVVYFVDSLIATNNKRMVLDFAESVVWEISKEGLSVSELIKSIEENKERVGIKDWSMNQTTLKEVFVNLVSESNKNENTNFEESHEEEDQEGDEQGMTERLAYLQRRLEQTQQENENYRNELEKYQTLHVSPIHEEEEDLEEGGEETSSIDTREESSDENNESTTTTTTTTTTTKEEEKEEEESDQYSNCLSIFIIQTYVLLKKEYYLAIRNPINNLCQVAFGAMLVVLVYILFWTQARGEKKTFFDAYDITPLYPCQTYHPTESCYQFVYSTDGDEFGESIMQFMFDNNYEIIPSQVRKFPSTPEMLDWIHKSPNLTISALSISNSNDTSEYSSYPILKYTIFNNLTSLSSTEGDMIPITIRLQQIIDESILNVGSSTTKKKIGIKLKSFPLFEIKESPFKNDIFYTTTMTFCAVVIFVFIFSATTFVLQKSKGLHEFMISNGLKPPTLCLSYTVSFSIFGFLEVFFMWLFAFFFQIPQATETNVFVYLFIFILFTTTILSSLTFILPHLKDSRDVAAFFSFLVFVFLFVVSLFEGEILYAGYAEAEESWFYWTVLFLVIPTFFSPFNFAKIFADISFRTIPMFDFERKEFVENDGYGFGDIFRKNSHPNLGLESEMTMLWIGYLMINILVYLVIGCLVRCFSTRIYLRKRNKPKPPGVESEDVETKKDCIIVEDVYKTYSGGPSFFSGKNKVLKGVNLRVKENELVGVLGHNGAGKSTLINMITGEQKITKGEIFVHDKSVKKSPHHIQRNIGIVPQYDVLLEKLKAKEILELFGVCKGMKHSKVLKKIDVVLKNVGLYNVKNEFVGNFSGGMKRRLSCGLAMMGGPKTLLIDEPTVGVDPYSCFKICKIFHGMKKDHSLIVTTHDLQEAELLSDKIAILQDGKFQCFGTPLELKSLCGSGYFLSINLKKSDTDSFEVCEDRMFKFFEKYLPSSKLHKSSMNSFVFSVEKEKIPELIKATKKLEELYKEEEEIIGSSESVSESEEEEEDVVVMENVQIVDIVEEEEKEENNVEDEKCFFDSWGISQSTLEDVYVKVVTNALYKNLNKENEKKKLEKDEML